MVWSEEGRRISERLRVMADKVSPGESCADIGADHGYLGLYLYDRGIAPRVILTDISEASLAKAKTAAGAAQFGNDVSFRVGNGLEVIEPGEVDVIVIAGMGGQLIRDIMSADLDKTRSFNRFVLQPRTSSGPLRKWLLEADFAVLSEDIVREGEFLPEIITVAPRERMTFTADFDYFDHEAGMLNDGEAIYDLTSALRESLVGSVDVDDDVPGEDSIYFEIPIWMLKASGPIIEYIDRRIAMREGILAGLARARTPDEGAIRRVEGEIEYLRQLRELRLLKDKN